MSDGRWIALPLSSSRRQRVDLIGLEERVADRRPTRGEEREAHRAADDERVDDPEERVDDSELVAHLGAAEHRDERPSRVVTHAEEHLDLVREQPTRRAGQRLRRADDRRVGAVRSTERVVDVGVVAVDELRDECGVVALLPRVEPQVLEQLDAGRELREPRPHGRHRVAVVGLALRPAEVTARGDARAALDEPLDRGQRGADAEVVDDLAVVERHVEVSAQEHALARDVGQVFEERELQVGRRVSGSQRRRRARGRRGGSSSPTRCRTNRAP